MGNMLPVMRIKHVLINMVRIKRAMPPMVFVVNSVDLFKGMEFMKSDLFLLNTKPNKVNDTIMGIMYIPIMVIWLIEVKVGLV